MSGCDLSLILVNFNTAPFLETCLAKLYASPPKSSFEVIVVDNASRDGSVEMLARRFPQVRAIANTYNHGFAVANNQAYRVSSGEFVMPVNPDTEITPGSLDLMVDFLRQRSDVGLVSPVVADSNGVAAVPMATFFPLDPPQLFRVARRRAGPTPRLPTEPFEVRWIWSTGFVCRRAALDGARIFDEDMFLFGEEYSVARAVRDRGYRMYVLPSAHLVHHASVTWNRDEKRLFVARQLGMAALWTIRRKEYGAILANVNQWLRLTESAALWAALGVSEHLGWPRPRMRVDYRAQAIASWHLLRTGEAFVREINDYARRYFNDGQPPPASPE